MKSKTNQISGYIYHIFTQITENFESIFGLFDKFAQLDTFIHYLAFNRNVTNFRKIFDLFFIQFTLLLHHLTL